MLLCDSLPHGLRDLGGKQEKEFGIEMERARDGKEEVVRDTQTAEQASFMR